ncbi:hypothetical protein SAMN05216480_12214 [Pustulibacterium marinum]|uniref:DUF4468 domain-containing protein n=1 Tax=Pustulibacterium marinum TaxID=1224947 RepID=A0A1I7IUI7_9FLAO|nr:hypothetical protein [Pustulibacterium marinum]SFU76551.1 hypothetical protein SAMN05216480_12214 [Pustulibacterium marinum]
MKPHIVYLFILCTLSFLNLNAQATNENEIKTFYLQPIFGFDLSLGEDKQKVFEKFHDSHGVNEGEFTVDTLWNTLVTEFKISLFNHEKTKVKYILAFENETLDYYQIYFSIGSDYNHFWKLIDILKKEDKYNVNQFLYNEKKFVYIDFTDDIIYRKVTCSRCDSKYFCVRIDAYIKKA